MNTRPKASQSITAISILHGVLLCAKNEETEHLIDSDLAVLSDYFFNAALKKYPKSLGGFLYSSMNRFPYMVQQYLFETFGGISGFPEHCGMRKLMIEQLVQQAINSGTQQVIILGAGYDTLSLRIHARHPDVKFFELDRGETRQTKLNIIASLMNPAANPDPRLRAISARLSASISNPANLHFVDCDLSQPNWHSVLNNHSAFDKRKSSIVVMEGLTMYLTEQQNAALLNILKTEVLNAKSQVILSFMESTQQMTGNLSIASVTNESKELFKCKFMPDKVLTFANAQHYSVIGKALSADMQGWAGNSAAVSAHGRHMIKENYYLLCNESGKQADKIDQVPNVEIHVPRKLHRNDCTIM